MPLDPSTEALSAAAVSSSSAENGGDAFMKCATLSAPAVRGSGEGAPDIDAKLAARMECVGLWSDSLVTSSLKGELDE